MNDYHSIWLYIPTSVIASDPIGANATPAELAELAYYSAMADDLVKQAEAKAAAKTDQDLARLMGYPK